MSLPEAPAPAPFAPAIFRAAAVQPQAPLPAPTLSPWWLVLPASLLVLGVAIFGGLEMRQQRQALAAAQAELELARQDRVNLEAHRQQLGLWQQQLQHQTQQMQQLQSQFDHARDELRGVKEISTAREMELEKLVTFLKSEMEAAEAQVEELKKLLGTRQEGRRVLP